MKYKITIEKAEDYEVTKGISECEDGEQYASTYSIPDGKKYKTVQHKTGQISTMYTQIYQQEVDMQDIKDVIKAANGFLNENN